MSYVHIKTDAGTLRGIDNAGTVSLLGVPYGATTGGANRFLGPQPVERWRGVRDALTFGPSAPQVDTRSHAFYNGPRVLSSLYPRGGWPAEAAPIDEDCLRLNIWAPADRGDQTLPVLVWLHGGGFTHGSGNEMVFNGDVLAQAGEMIVVTVTHRLGIMGFLDLSELGLPDSANAGMLDIVAALEWVQRNIAAVGGDATRVTICGQSGGSGKVATLTAMPASRRLFSRAVMMSGPITSLPNEDDSRQLSASSRQRLGTGGSLEKLRDAPLSALLELQAAVLAEGPLGSGFATGLKKLPGFGPRLDRQHLPHNPFTDKTANADTQLMIGWTTHEAGLMMADDPEYTTSMNAEGAIRLLESSDPEDGAEIYAQLSAEYPYEPPHLLWSRHVSDRAMRQPAIDIAKNVTAAGGNAWVYQFEQPTEILGGLLGACHSLELAYVFGTVDRVPLTGRDPKRIAVSQQMMMAWASFVHTGNPGWGSWNEGETLHRFGTPLGPDSTLPEDIDIARRLR